MGAMTVGYQVNETDRGTASQTKTLQHIGVSYAVSDDLSVSLNSSKLIIESAQKTKKLQV